MGNQWHEVRLDHDEGDGGFAKAAPSIVEAIRLIDLTQVFSRACALGTRRVQYASLPESAMTDVEKASQMHALDAQCASVAPYLTAMCSTFAPLHATPPPHAHPIEQAEDGLVAPGLVLASHTAAATTTRVNGCQSTLLTAEHPCADYALFCEVFNRLTALVASGEWFSAAEPRLNILRGRYDLHRTFNGEREDGGDAAAHASPRGGPDLRRACSMDVRRLEGSVSASTVVRFLSDLLEKEPDLQVVKPTSAHTGKPAVDAASPSSSHPYPDLPRTAAEQGTAERESSLTVQAMLERCFGRELSTGGALYDGRHPHERRRQLQSALSVESLCLHPLNGMSEGGLRWMDAVAEKKIHAKAAAISSASASSAQRFGDASDYRRGEGASAVPFLLPATTSSPYSARQERAAEVLRHVLSVGEDGCGGELLQRLVVPALAQTLSWSGDGSRLELELTLSGRDADELPRLARWCVSSGLLDIKSRSGEPLVQFALRLTQSAYQKGSTDGTVMSSDVFMGSSHEQEAPAGGFRGVLENMFRPLWAAMLAPGAHPDVVALLERVVTMAVSLDATTDAVVQEMPASAALPADDYPVTGPPPPDALFLFQIWRHVQWLNAFVYSQRVASPAHAAGDDATATPTGAARTLFAGGALRLRLHCLGTTERTSINESLLGILLCDQVVNPSYAMDWGPLTYLYYVTQRHVQLSPSCNRFSSPVVRQSLMGALSRAVSVGLHTSIATVEPLLFSTTNDALIEELDHAVRYFSLSPADAAELCLRGVESGAALAPLAHRRIFGDAWPRATAGDNAFQVTQVPSLRLHFRDVCLTHELDLLCRRGLTMASHHGGRTGDAMREARSSLWLRSSFAQGLDKVNGLLDASSSSSTPRNGLRHALFRVAGLTELRDETASAPTPARVRLGRGVEQGVWYPRIVITGPSAGAADSGGARAAAKALVQIVNRRAFYQQFVVTQPAATAPAMASASRASRVSAPSGLSAGNVSSYLPPATAAFRSATGAESASTSSAVSHTTAVQHTSPVRVVMVDGIMRVAGTHTDNFADSLPSWSVFQHDVRALRAAASDVTVQRLAQKRLGMLENKYQLHVALTNDDEVGYSFQLSSRSTDRPLAAITATAADSPWSCADACGAAEIRYVAPGRLQKNDVYNCVKVDVHVHMAGGITAPSLLRFMKQKLKTQGEDIVGLSSTDKRAITLREVFSDAMAEPGETASTPTTLNPLTSNASTSPSASKMQLTRARQEVTAREESARSTGYVRLENLTIANLQVHAGKATYNRFDEFNNRYSPMGVASLRTLFLKTDNFMGGRYFAELIHRTFARQEEEGNVFSENRLSIYGRRRDEWDRLARWFVQHGMSHSTNRWMVQVPRLFHLYKRTGQLQNFGEMLENMFAPLWEATLEPEKHPFLNAFLAHVSGFDSVDNESDREPDKRIRRRPSEWTNAENPPFAYYMYYMWANIASLNHVRAARGLATFDFRPHAGESGDPDHMADAFFLADGIGHGIQLRHRPVLEYLYYLTQIPLGIVPLSNNALFCRYQVNPFPRFLHRGLKVTLATDGALMFHHTEQPLIEEYSTAQNVWNLSSADICEVARNSVLMSGFPPAQKEAWLGPLFDLASMAGNDVTKSRVPMTRVAFRYEVFLEEAHYLQGRAEASLHTQAMASPAVEELETLERVGLTREEVLAQRLVGQPLPPREVENMAARAEAAATPRHFRVATANL